VHYGVRLARGLASLNSGRVGSFLHGYHHSSTWPFCKKYLLLTSSSRGDEAPTLFSVRIEF
jgi:hypothetical protein